MEEEDEGGEEEEEEEETEEEEGKEGQAAHLHCKLGLTPPRCTPTNPGQGFWI